jgi:alpha-L-arabinofuranosidase
MGHYSYFVKPGMKRIDVSSGLQPEEEAQNLMVSAYLDPTNEALTMILVNYSEEEAKVALDGKQWKNYKYYKHYLTNADENINLDKQDEGAMPEQIALPKRSISTLMLQKTDEI